MGNNEWAIPLNNGKLCVRPMFEYVTRGRNYKMLDEMVYLILELNSLHLLHHIFLVPGTGLE